MVFVDSEWLMAAPLSGSTRGGLVRLTLPGDTPEAAHLACMELVVALKAQLPGAVKIASEQTWPGGQAR